METLKNYQNDTEVYYVIFKESSRNFCPSVRLSGVPVTEQHTFEKTKTVTILSN